MLQCTPTAAAALDEVRRHNNLPEEHGVRIAAAPGPDGGVGLSISFSPTPAEGDQVSEQHGTTLMVAPDIADHVADMTLDLVPDPSANGDAAPQLVLRPAEPEG